MIPISSILKKNQIEFVKSVSGNPAQREFDRPNALFLRPQERKVGY
jgi:hypothetical protein